MPTLDDFLQIPPDSLEQMLGLSGGAQGLPQQQGLGQTPGMSTREQRRKMLEDEAWQIFRGKATPKRPDTKLSWREILGATLNPKLLPTILERKMTPYYDEMDAQKQRESALDRMLGLYRPQAPYSTPGGLYDPENKQIIEGTAPQPKEPAEPRPINVPGRGLFDPAKREFLPGTAPPEKPPTPHTRYIPGRGLYDLDQGAFIPDTAGQKPTSSQERDRVLTEGRKVYASALQDARKRLGVSYLQSPDKEQAEAQAQSEAEAAYKDYVDKFGARQSLEDRLQELLAAGMNQEEAFAQLEQEGYE